MDVHHVRAAKGIKYEGGVAPVSCSFFLHWGPVIA